MIKNTASRTGRAPDQEEDMRKGKKQRMNRPAAPRVRTELELVSEQAEQTAKAHQAQLQSLYTEMGQCSDPHRLEADLQRRVNEELISLRSAGASLRSAQACTGEMEDELSARLRDVETDLNRKWYRFNPPSNTSIDVAEQQSGHFAQGINVYKLCLILIIGSFAGVAIELLWCLITNGYLESRSGLVYGPFNMLYGVGAAVLSVALYRFRNRGRWLSFLGGFVVGSVVEYLCSLFQEMLLGSRSWDYSGMPFNLNGRICLLYSIFWGILGVLWIKDLYPRMSKWILKLPNRPGKIITWVLTVFMALNCLVSAVAVWRWAERVSGVSAENGFEELLDARFPDERMERIYANMSFQ